MLSLRWKIFLTLLLTALIAPVFTGALEIRTFWQLQRTMLAHSAHLGMSVAKDSETILSREQLQHFVNVTREKAALLDNRFSMVSDQVRQVAALATAIYNHPEQFKRRQIDYYLPADVGSDKAHLETAPGIEFAAIKDEAELLANLGDLLAIIANRQIDEDAYFGTETGFCVSVATNDLPLNKNYDPRSRPWYQAAVNAGKLGWSDVFQAAGNAGMAISCAMPVYQNVAGKNVLRGVVSKGLALSGAVSAMINDAAGDDGWALLLNQNGKIVATSQGNIAADWARGDWREIDYLHSEMTSRRELARRMLRGENGSLPLPDERDESRFATFCPLSEIPWSLAIVISRRAIAQNAAQMQENVLFHANAANGSLERWMHVMVLIALSVVAAITLIAITLAVRLSRGIVTPLQQLTVGAARIANGELDRKLRVRGNNEIAVLARAFNRMLKRVKTIAAAQARDEAEVTVAAQIQARMLPRYLALHPAAAVAARMRPAKAVGGDFYDCFLLAENRVAFVIADVAGKGLPAALFMTRAKILLKNCAQTGVPLDEIFIAANRQLCEDNRAELFVTVFLAALDCDTGVFTYVNAGHNPPMICRAGKFSRLDVKPAMPLGMFPDLVYVPAQTVLAAGEQVFFYTDGVNEAANVAGELFGNENLLTVLNAHAAAEPARQLDAMFAALDTFTVGVEPSDDITMMTVKWR